MLTLLLFLGSGSWVPIWETWIAVTWTEGFGRVFGSCPGGSTGQCCKKVFLLRI